MTERGYTTAELMISVLAREIRDGDRVLVDSSAPGGTPLLRPDGTAPGLVVRRTGDGEEPAPGDGTGSAIASLPGW